MVKIGFKPRRGLATLAAAKHADNQEETMTLGVVAVIKVQAGKEAEFEQVFAGLQAEVRANEPGNLQYDLFKDAKEAGTYVVMEKYADQEALTAHGKSAHFRAAGPKLGPLLAGAPKVDTYSFVS